MIFGIKYQTRLKKERKKYELFHDIKILIDTDDKMPNDIPLENVVILIIFDTKDRDKFIHNYF